MGLTDALPLIFIMILHAQFMPEVLWLGAFVSAIISVIIVPRLASLLLWYTLGQDNLALVAASAIAKKNQ